MPLVLPPPLTLDQLLHKTNKRNLIIAPAVDSIVQLADCNPLQYPRGERDTKALASPVKFRVAHHGEDSNVKAHLQDFARRRFSSSCRISWRCRRRRLLLARLAVGVELSSLESSEVMTVDGR